MGLERNRRSDGGTQNLRKPKISNEIRGYTFPFRNTLKSQSIVQVKAWLLPHASAGRTSLLKSGEVILSSYLASPGPKSERSAKFMKQIRANASEHPLEKRIVSIR